MTIDTFLPELILMNIFVAIGAGVVFNAFKLLKVFPILNFNFMAFPAIYRLMLTFQREFGFAMIKLWGRFKSFVAVAILAVYRKGFLMIIGMAG